MAEKALCLRCKEDEYRAILNEDNTVTLYCLTCDVNIVVSITES